MRSHWNDYAATDQGTGLLSTKPLVRGEPTAARAANNTNRITAALKSKLPELTPAIAQGVRDVVKGGSPE